jgi:tripartite-type tricarboxylate transporter receptor subunit TctC
MNHDTCRLKLSRWLPGMLMLLALGWSASVQAQAPWPTKTVRIVVPYTPGGGNDILARLLAEKLTTSLGQSVVVENKPGAGAVVGTDFVAKAAPDGHTLLVAASGPMVFNQVLLSKPPYNSVSDFAPVSMVGSFPLILGVIDSSPARNLSDLVQWSKANPNQSNYSYPAASFQLVMELIKSRSGLIALNVPYPGSAPALNAVMTQEVQMTLVDSGPVASLLKAGKLRALAVTSDQRMPAYPQVPTLKEQGIDLAVNLWTGLFAPAGTPAPIVKRLEEEVARIMRLPETQERLAKLDIRPIGGTAADLGRTLAQEIELWQQVAKANNIKPQ